MRTDESDAKCLRDAAWVMQTRVEHVTFSVRVVIRVLQRTADWIENKGRKLDDTP